MEDRAKSKAQLIQELVELRRRVSQLESDLGPARQGQPGVAESSQTDEVLPDSAAYLRRVAEALPVTLSYFDTRQCFRFANKLYEACVDRPLADIEGKFLVEVFSAAMYAEILPYVEMALAGQKVNYEQTIPDRQGQLRDYQIEYTPHLEAEGQVIGVFVLVQDVTERKQAEKKIRQRTAQLEALREVGLELTAQLELDKLLLSILSRASELLDTENGGLFLYRPEQEALELAAAIGPARGHIGALLRRGEGLSGRVWESGRPLMVENYQQWLGRADAFADTPITTALGVPIQWGQEFLGVLSVINRPAPFSAADAELLSLFATQAATAIYNARLYEQTRQDAEIKATLLKEINHRVKNDLAAIIGLLHLERGHAGLAHQAAYQAIMEDLINRIQGLATVHSLLSASAWSPLLLSDLAGQVIASTLQTLPPDKSIAVQVSPSPVRVNPQQANNLALLINELATNTLKYAASLQDLTEITVRIDSQADWVTVEFRDNGPGYPADVLSGQRHNTGLYLIRSLAQTGLAGQVSLRNDHGAVTLIRFKAQEVVSS